LVRTQITKTRALFTLRCLKYEVKYGPNKVINAITFLMKLNKGSM